jgi:hypothetical protein
MEIGTKFAIRKEREGLYVLELVENVHELNIFFAFLNDTFALNVFFENNINDLQSEFYNKINENIPISVEKAVQITSEMAENLSDLYLELLLSPQDIFESKIGVFFRPLSKKNAKHPLHINVNDMKKAYGSTYNRKINWLRVYALKIENTFIITGGAIKLTDGMVARNHTKEELEKLYKTAAQLKSEHFTEDSSFETGYIEFYS